MFLEQSIPVEWIVLWKLFLGIKFSKEEEGEEKNVTANNTVRRLANCSYWSNHRLDKFKEGR